MAPRGFRSPSFVLAAAVVAAASAGLVQAAAPRVVATGSIHGTITLPDAPGLGVTLRDGRYTSGG